MSKLGNAEVCFCECVLRCSFSANRQTARLRSFIKLVIIAIALAIAPNFDLLAQSNVLVRETVQTVTKTNDGTPLFDVASIKPTGSGSSGMRLEFTPNGFIARGVVLRQIIHEAYGIYEENRVYGGPPWLNSERFDVDAKISAGVVADFRNYTLDQRRSMLQALLTDRFKLKVHHETKQIHAYALIVDKDGPKLATANEVYHSQVKGVDGLVTQSQRGHLTVQGLTMPAFARLLYPTAGMTVVDETGLTGSYDFSLQWAPNEMAVKDQQEFLSSENSGPSIFTALREQLGLKLVPSKVPLDVIMIDGVERPSPN
jgi:uncharacterized protein (TIGR03435 family)